MIDINELLGQVDAYFDENQPKRAEEILIQALIESKENKNDSACLQILNELIGYYRQTSEEERLRAVIDEVLQLAERMQLNGTIPYATTLLNAANGYRSIGELDEAKKLYLDAEAVYDETLNEKDMLRAGLYNNISLLFQELSDYRKACQYLEKALVIVKEANAGFEIAVTYANLANTYAALGNLEKAEEYGKESVKCFEDRDLRDAHYAAALSALGTIAYRQQKYDEAELYFSKAMDSVETSIGRNRQYEKLKENRDLALAMKDKGGESLMRGLDICKRFYEEYGAPMIHEKFSAYENRIAVGLVGEGSDCFGYDDAISRDHDWGPGFCMWVSDETYEEIGEALSEAYKSLPTEFMGYKVAVDTYFGKRRGVRRISDFYKSFLLCDSYETIDWSLVEDERLAAAINGEVFRDDEGLFEAVRKQLMAGYPESARYLRLADAAARFSQTGQYNYFRCMERGDRLTADRMLCECMGHVMRLGHYIKNVYPPHDKWMFKSFNRLEGMEEISALLQDLHAGLKLGDEELIPYLTDKMEQMGSKLAYLMNQEDIISDVDDYLEHHTDELVKKAAYSQMTNEELVNRIARAEFTAFDKVKNEGGRASCQNDWPTFSVMRKSQYLTWERNMLLQYLYDFEREFSLGHNLITEKYGRMMESTAPERYEDIKEHFPPLSEQKKAVIEQIVSIQMEMAETFAKEYPLVAGNARSLHTYEDNIVNTSYETYLRGEISTYSDKMLQLYGRHVAMCFMEKRNIAGETIENTARLYGYKDIESFQDSI